MVDEIVEFLVIFTFAPVRVPRYLELDHSREMVFFRSFHRYGEVAFLSFFETAKIGIEFSTEVFFYEPFDYWTVMLKVLDVNFLFEKHIREVRM